MKTISVEVRPDHLQRMAAVKKPILAVTELVWNGLDADATEIAVSLESTLLGGLTAIRVQDNGTGMTPVEAEQSFGSLGGSWKKFGSKSKHGGRLLHGRAGKGRFRAFALGEHVEWLTCARVGKRRQRYTVRGSLGHLGTFEISDIEDVAEDAPTGTTVTITNLLKEFRLRGDQPRMEMTEQLAIYLRQYRDVVVRYDGARVDPTALETHSASYAIGPVTLEDGREIDASLLLIEWSIPTERSLFLCDEAGFAYHRLAPKIQAPGFQFTAYLRSPYVRELHDQNLLELDEFNEGTTRLIEAAKQQLKTHFRGRTAQLASELVEDWKKRDIYPYTGEPSTAVEQAQRQVFDVVALNVSEYLPDFSSTDDRTQRLQLRLLKQAVEGSPEVAQRILAEVLELPLDKQEQLAALLERTSLSAIISAAKLVADRLDFVRGLERLVFDSELKKQLLERRQLHKILEKHTWLFGEHFNLTTSDKSLDDVLAKHQHLLGRTVDDDADPVRREDGSTAIIDLMLSRKVPQPRTEAREHLIVELKRPAVKITLDVYQQIVSYAFAVAGDERFRDTNTRWVFWAVSNEVSGEVQKLTAMDDKPRGQAYKGGDVEIWVKSWGQIIEDCRSRLQFFQQELQYEASDESAFAYLRKVHAEYLPAPLVTDGPQASGGKNPLEQPARPARARR